MQIETKRLLLSPWGVDDWELLRPIATDSKVMRFISGGEPWTDVQIRNFVDRCRTTFHERGFTRWKLELKTTGELIGFCGVGFLLDEPDPEIGWWLGPDHWGKGLAIEAARVAFEDAIVRVGLRRVISIAHPDNVKSIRIMQGLNLRFEGARDYRGTPVVVYGFRRNSELGGDDC